MMKEVLSTTQAAKFAYLSQQSIIRACNEGELKHFRTPGSGKFRRILPVDLRRWMFEHNIPTDMIDGSYPELCKEIA